MKHVIKILFMISALWAVATIYAMKENKPSIWLKPLDDDSPIEISAKQAKFIKLQFPDQAPHSKEEALPIPFKKNVIQLLKSFIPKAKKLYQFEKIDQSHPHEIILKSAREEVQEFIMDNASSLMDLYNLANYLNIDEVMYSIRKYIIDFCIYDKRCTQSLIKNINNALFNFDQKALKETLIQNLHEFEFTEPPYVITKITLEKLSINQLLLLSILKKLHATDMLQQLISPTQKDALLETLTSYNKILARFGDAIAHLYGLGDLPQEPTPTINTSREQKSAADNNQPHNLSLLHMELLALAHR